jgi:hypothetical protein
MELILPSEIILYNQLSVVAVFWALYALNQHLSTWHNELNELVGYFRISSPEDKVKSMKHKGPSLPDLSLLFYITKKVNISLIQAKTIMKLLTTNVVILWAAVALGLAASYYLICSYNVIGSYIGSVAPGAGTHVATNYVGSYILGNMRLRGLI